MQFLIRCAWLRLMSVLRGLSYERGICKNRSSNPGITVLVLKELF